MLLYFLKYSIWTSCKFRNCVVERITYQNADNGYTVLKCAVKNAQDLVTVVGIMPDTHVGSVLALEGVWKVDAKYTVIYRRINAVFIMQCSFCCAMQPFYVIQHLLCRLLYLAQR